MVVVIRERGPFIKRLDLLGHIAHTASVIVRPIELWYAIGNREAMAARIADVRAIDIRERFAAPTRTHKNPLQKLWGIRSGFRRYPRKLRALRNHERSYREDVDLRRHERRVGLLRSAYNRVPSQVETGV